MKTAAGALIGLVIITGCINERKALKYFDKHPERLPIDVQVKYLPGDEYHDTTYLPSDTLIYFDTVWQNQYGEKIVEVRKPCPPSSVITIRKTDTILKSVENTIYKDKVIAAYEDRDNAIAEMKKAKQAAKNRLHWLLAVILAVLAVVVRRITKRN